ncbi:hypothetical protein [Chishuiella sp.]|uniref:helix-turn-helix transcriptional regulator n=1 Tax=Chishuiella sp. TaxID=1969467 RepID=UPI0028A7D480|nr:hypothetical protein [Chishuiella sp.]
MEEVQLSKEEIRVASLFAKGLSYKEVANVTSKSENTLNKQVQSIYNKTLIKRSLTSLMLWFNNSIYKELNLN